MNGDQDVKVNPDVTPETKAVLEETAAPVETSFANPASPAKKRPLKLIIAAILVAVGIVLIGGSVFGYQVWYQNPDKVVHDAIINALKAKTGTAQGSITYTSDDFKMDIKLGSKSAEGGEEFTLDTTLTVTNDGTDQEFNATGTGRLVEDTLYVKISGVQSIVEDTAAQSFGQIPEYAAGIFEKIEDRWISIKASDYQEVSGDIANQQDCTFDLIEKIKTDTTMTDEVAELYRDNQVIIVEEELGSKDVNGVDSFGYKVAIDREAAALFATGLENTAYGKALMDCSEDIDFTEIAEDITAEVPENTDEPVTELWVSKLGHEITGIAIYGQSNGTDELNISLQPTFTNDVSVEIPEGATSLKTVLEEIQEVIMNSGSGTFMPEMTVPSGFDTGDIDPVFQSAV